MSWHQYWSWFFKDLEISLIPAATMFGLLVFAFFVGVFQKKRQ